MAVYTLENEFIINSFIHYHNKFGIIKALLLMAGGIEQNIHKLHVVEVDAMAVVGIKLETCLIHEHIN